MHGAAHGSQSAADGAFDHAIGLLTNTHFTFFTIIYYRCPVEPNPPSPRCCLRQGFDNFPVHMGHALEDHLGNPVAIIYRKGFCSEVDEDDLDLAP